MYNETLGKLHFWLFFVGFHLTFDFMHIPGMLGMPRRIYTYEPGRGWDIWNVIVTIGVVFQAVGDPGFRRQPDFLLFPRQGGWQRPLGRLDARVVHKFSAARVQLCRDPKRSQPPSAVGSEAPRRSRLEVRVADEHMDRGLSAKTTSIGGFLREDEWECTA